jgi:hypothetical protein
MRFLAPAYLHWLWLILLPVALWLFRRQAKQIQVSTLLFFRNLAREHQESAWLRQVKRWLSLALTLLVLIALILALARPTADNGTGGAASIVFLLDHSASMAIYHEGRSRLDVAKQRLREHLHAAPNATIFSLVTTGAEVSVPFSRSRNRRELERVLNTIDVEPAEDQTELAWQTAQRLAGLDTPSTLIHLSDAPFQAPKLPAEVATRAENVASDTILNVGITDFDLRAEPLDQHRYEAFLRLTAATGNTGPVSSEVEVKIGGRLAHLRQILLKPGETTVLLLPLEGVKGEPMDILCRTAGDVLPLDDHLETILPTPKPLIAAWLADKPDPFTELALSAMVEAGRVEMLKGGPSNWPLTDKPDILVLENWLPPTAPDLPTVYLNPKGQVPWLKTQPLDRPVPLEGIRCLRPDHPVSYGITTSRLSLELNTEIPAVPGLDPLWVATSSNLLLVGEVNAQRAVVTSFAPSQSEQLALQPAYPLLLANAIHWCADALQSRKSAKPQRAGSLLAAEGELRWQTQTGPITDPILGSGLLLRRIGTWQTSDGRTGTSILASQHETDLPAPAEQSPAAASSLAAKWNLTGSSLLLWFALALLLLESYLLHRKAVY